LLKGGGEGLYHKDYLEIMASLDLLQDKFRGAILGCFLGDAFGAGFEGMSPDEVISRLSTL
jgi:hypothetical protein